MYGGFLFGSRDLIHTASIRVDQAARIPIPENCKPISRPTEIGNASRNGARVDGVAFIEPDGEGGVSLASYNAVVGVRMTLKVFVVGASEARNTTVAERNIVYDDAVAWQSVLNLLKDGQFAG